MTAQEIIKTVEFVVDGSGKPKAAIVDMQLWKTFVTWLESLEDGEPHARDWWAGVRKGLETMGRLRCGVELK